MKKNFILLLMAMLSMTVMLRADNGFTLWAIDEAHFPDPLFRQWVAAQDGNNDGFLSLYEAKLVQTIDLSDARWSGITSVGGIEYFDALTSVNLSGTSITTLGMSFAPSLHELYCRDTQIIWLNLSENKGMSNLDCCNTPLATLLLPTVENPNSQGFAFLNCKNTRLASVNLPDNKYGNVWFDHSSNLADITFGTNADVSMLSCSNTALTSLAVPASCASTISSLVCDSCQLTSLDLSNMTGLYYLYCQCNELTSLNVANCENLRNLSCWDNHLTTLDISHNLNVTLQAPGNQQYVAQTATLPIHYIGGSACMRIAEGRNYGEVTKVIVYYADGGTYINNNPSSTSYSGVLKLTNEQREIERVVYDYQPKLQSKSLSVDVTPSEYGIPVVSENFPDDAFRAYLKAQSYGADELITPDELETITKMNVQYKGISDLTGIKLFTALTELNCSGNNLTELDVSSLTGLTKLNCDENQITSLGLSAQTLLEWLNAESNALANLSLPAGGTLSYLNVDNNQLASINLTDQRGLENIFCDNNNLSTIDVSYNTALKYLDCSGNSLSTLDVSHNTALEQLYCQNNSIASLDLSANTALKYLDCSGNQLTALEVTENTALFQIYCSTNQLTTLDLTQQSVLWGLRCDDNQLTSIVLPDSRVLTSVYCYKNQLTGDAMVALLEALPTSSTNRELRIYYDGASTEGNEINSIQVKTLATRGWIAKHYDGSDWVNYAGLPVAHDLWLSGQQVTSSNCDNLTALLRVSGTVAKFDELTNTLTLGDVSIIGQTNTLNLEPGLKNGIDGLTIIVVGTNSINIPDTTAIVLTANTTIKGTGRLTAKSQSNGIYIHTGTLTVARGVMLFANASEATPTQKTGFGIYGRTTLRLDPRTQSTTTIYNGSLAIEDRGTAVSAIGSMVSVATLNMLTFPDYATLSAINPSNNREVDAVFRNHNVCIRNNSTYLPTTYLVRIQCPELRLGDVNEDGTIDDADVAALVDAVLGKSDLLRLETMDINEDGLVSLADVTALVNNIQNQ